MTIEVEVSPPKENIHMGMLANRTLVRNSVWNFVGQGAPMLVAIFAIPRLIEGLGKDRFGILSLAWMLVGYFSLFDLGLGRALTKLVAEKLGAGRPREIPALVWTSLFVMLVFGLAGTLIVGLLAPYLVYHVLKMPKALQAETLTCVRLFALSVPVAVSTVGLRGILEAYQRFDLTNVIRVPMGIFTFLGPVFVLPFSKSLVPVIAVLLIGRVIAWLVHLIFCLYAIPSLRRSIMVEWSAVRPLLSFGGWITVSNIIGPLLLYLDRFLIGSTVSMSEVAYYTTPYDVITKLLIIPIACLGVMFPAFSTTFAQDTKRTAKLYSRAVTYDMLLLVPIAMVGVLFARKGLVLWVGADFSAHSFRVAQFLVVGVVMNSYGLISAALIQATGRPDLTAKLHMVELPLYLTYLWPLLHAFGITGAALAWTIRVTISAIVLRIMARRLLRESLWSCSNQAYEQENELAL